LVGIGWRRVLVSVTTKLFVEQYISVCCFAIWYGYKIMSCCYLFLQSSERTASRTNGLHTEQLLCECTVSRTHPVCVLHAVLFLLNTIVQYLKNPDIDLLQIKVPIKQFKTFLGYLNQHKNILIVMSCMNCAPCVTLLNAHKHPTVLLVFETHCGPWRLYTLLL